MKFCRLEISEVVQFEPTVFGDQRGFSTSVSASAYLGSDRIALEVCSG